MPFLIAHVLDKQTGYSKHIWIVGQHVSRETAQGASSSRDIFVINVSERGKTRQMICQQSLWNEAKAEFESTGLAVPQ